MVHLMFSLNARGAEDNDAHFEGGEWGGCLIV